MARLEEIATRLAAPEHRRTEADIQAGVRDLLLHGDLDLDDQHVRLEAATPTRRRIDVEIGATVIEVKRDLSRGRTAAEDQLGDYLTEREREHGGRYVGILTDGLQWRAYRNTHDGLRLVTAYELSGGDADALVVWLEGILATRQQIAPRPEEVARRLGADASATQLDLSELAWIYEGCADQPGVQLKRELWARLLTTAFGTSFDADDTQLFLNHTYLVVLASLVAHSVLDYDLTTTHLEADELLTGRVFSEHHILGVVEPSFFDWPAQTPEGRGWVRNLARRVGRFRWSEVEHDVLKVLYEEVISAEVRHSLGEYYTPDWLAKAMIDEVVDDPLRHRVLDPCAGSGTYVYWAVRHALEACETAGMTNAEAITSVTSRVMGMDIHPVAVALARVTYLLAIGPRRLADDRPRFAVPVWLGDSMQYQRRDELLDAEHLTVYTTDGAELFATELRFPDRVVDDIRWFDSLVVEMTEKAADRSAGDPVPSMKATYDRHGVHPDDRDTLDATMQALCGLCDAGRDSIWGYFVRNEARPRWLSRSDNRVDRLVGNVPWLSFRYMTEAMQDSFRQLSEERGLWAGAKVATHQDLSALFVVRCVEQYLNEHGRFGFLMPLAVLTRQAYAGFRTGDWGRGAAKLASNLTTVDFDLAWDLHEVKPRIFPVPPAAVFGTRTDGDAGAMHAKAVKWSGQQPADVDAVTETLTVEEVPLVRMPTSDDEWSDYRDRFYQGATITPRSLTFVELPEPGPLGVPSGSVRVEARRGSRDRAPWKNLPTMKGVVEERFVFGVHHGPTTFPFRVLEPDRVVVPWVDGQVLEADDPELDRWPGLAAWWREASARWEEHRPAKSSLSLAGRVNYHNGLSAQSDAMNDLRVVYPKSGTYLAAAIVNDPRTFIDHKLYWHRARNIDEARYLTAVLNAPVINERLAPMQARGEHNPRDIDKYVWALPIPLFDASEEVHADLVELAIEGEQVASEVDVASTRFETARRHVREALVESGLAARFNRAVDQLLLTSDVS